MVLHFQVPYKFLSLAYSSLQYVTQLKRMAKDNDNDWKN